MTKERAHQMADEWNKEAEWLIQNGDPEQEAIGRGLERSADRLREDFKEFPRTNNLGNWRKENGVKL